MDNNFFIISLVRNKCNSFIESTLSFRRKCDIYKIVCILSHFYLCRDNFKKPDFMLLRILFVLYLVYCLASFIVDLYLLIVLITDPAVSTIYLLRPFSLTFLSLSKNGYFCNSITGYYNKFILIVMQVYRSEANEDRNSHPGSNISSILLRVFDWRNDILFGFERSYFNPL